MTTYNWTALTNGQTISTFDPNVDVFVFNDISISAANVVVDGDTDVVIPFTTLSYGGKSVTINYHPLSTTTTNVTFADGSQILIGDNTTGTVNDDNANTLTGGSGNDQIIGLGGADSLNGGDGNDLFTMYTGLGDFWGNDTINGGNGIDTLYFPDAIAPVTINLGAGTGTGGDGGSSLTLSGIENVIGASFNDTIQGGNAVANRLEGRDGNDVLTGGGTGDTSDDTLLGGNGNDLLRVTRGADSLDGGAGTDRIDFTQTSVAYTGATGVTVNLATHVADLNNASGGAGEVSTLVSIETVTGTAGNDSLTGGDASHALDSLGNTIGETFQPGGGNDTVAGGANGAVTIVGKSAFTTIVDYNSNTSGQAVSLNLATGVVSDGQGGTDTLIAVGQARGGAGNDLLVGGSLSRGSSGTFFEVLRGNGGNDTLNGGNATSDGNDASGDRADYANNTSLQAVNVNLGTGIALDGLGGTDTLIDIDNVYGGAGNDTLTGGTGNDDLDGGAGNDTLDGAAGSDTARFQQSTAAVIVNLSAGSITVNAVTVLAGKANDGMGGTDTLISMENVRGSDFNDYIRGSDDLNTRQFLAGDAGNDTIDGGAGIDFANYSYVAPALGGINAFIENGAGSVNDKASGTDTLINIEGLAGTHSNDTLTGGLGDQWFRGNGGSDSISGGGGNDWVLYSNDPSGVTINLGTGTATDGWNGLTGLLALGGTDTLVSIENAEASDHNDNITGSSGANELRGRSGNDSLNGGAGNDTLDGGVGVDTAVYAGAYRQSVLNGNPSVSATFNGPEGNDTLISIENLKFLDGSRSYDAGAHLWQAYRLYGAAFDRIADSPGLNYHTARLDTGVSLAVVAQDFTGSAEFQVTYGSLDNSGFVNQLYLNVLNRLADPGGLTYWLGQLSGGATRGDVLMGFSESPENIGNYAGQLSGGLWDINETAASAARLYWAALDRAPDVGGLTYWTGQLTSGVQTLSQAAGGFVGSPEFQSAYGSLNNTQFVTLLYANVLDRLPDGGGLAYWQGLLDTGTSRADVTLGFSESFEFQVNILAQIDNGITVI